MPYIVPMSPLESIANYRIISKLGEGGNRHCDASSLLVYEPESSGVAATFNVVVIRNWTASCELEGKCVKAILRRN